jgi:AraC family transcriptional regulator of adaptative response/methylated-DNA-[protein]-cysteine methyltransferase
MNSQITAACRMIEMAETPPSLTALAAAAGLSPSHFHRVFKAATGVTPKAYAKAQRAARMRAALSTAATVTEAIYAAGYNASSRFYEQSSATLGMTPRKFRRQGEGMAIMFALGECSLGHFLVARTEAGICSIALGDDPNALLNQLQTQFPAADFSGTTAEFDALVAQVVGLIEAPGQRVDLPLDIRGTAFQHRVWQALRAIPPGATATYTEIAAAIGAPRGQRAVAAACAANTLAVAIPCHRVIRLSGDLAGYRWGVERKRALLRREAK